MNDKLLSKYYRHTTFSAHKIIHTQQQLSTTHAICVRSQNSLLLFFEFFFFEFLFQGLVYCMLQDSTGAVSLCFVHAQPFAAGDGWWAYADDSLSIIVIKLLCFLLRISSSSILTVEGFDPSSTLGIFSTPEVGIFHSESAIFSQWDESL